MCHIDMGQSRAGAIRFIYLPNKSACGGDLTNGHAQTNEVLKEYEVLKPNEADKEADCKWGDGPGSKTQQAAPHRTVSCCG